MIPGNNAFNPPLLGNGIRRDELRVGYPSYVPLVCETNPECPDDATNRHDDEQCLRMDVLDFL